MDQAFQAVTGLHLTCCRALLLADGAAGPGLLAATRVAHSEIQPQGREGLTQAVAAAMSAAAPALASALINDNGPVYFRSIWRDH